MRKTFAFSILALALLLVSPAFADTCISFAPRCGHNPRLDHREQFHGRDDR